MCERPLRCAVVALSPASSCVLCTGWLSALDTTSYPASGNSKPGDGARSGAGGWLGLVCLDCNPLLE